MAETTEHVFVCDYDGCTNGPDGTPGTVTQESGDIPPGWVTTSNTVMVNGESGEQSAIIGGMFDSIDHAVANSEENLASELAALA